MNRRKPQTARKSIQTTTATNIVRIAHRRLSNISQRQAVTNRSISNDSSSTKKQKRKKQGVIALREIKR